MNADEKEKKALRRHPLLIPAGKFCYHVEPIGDGVEIAPTSPRLGYDLREANFGATEKMVLCPYWVLTEHETVRCDYLKSEVPTLSTGSSSMVADKIKECGVRQGPSQFAGLFSKTHDD